MNRRQSGTWSGMECESPAANGAHGANESLSVLPFLGVGGGEHSRLVRGCLYQLSSLCLCARQRLLAPEAVCTVFSAEQLIEKRRL